MFDSLRLSRPTRFDQVTRALVGLGALAFAVSVVFLLTGALRPAATPGLADGTVTSAVVSVQTLLPDLGGSILHSLPTFRL